MTAAGTLRGCVLLLRKLHLPDAAMAFAQAASEAGFSNPAAASDAGLPTCSQPLNAYVHGGQKLLLTSAFCGSMQELQSGTSTQGICLCKLCKVRVIQLAWQDCAVFFRSWCLSKLKALAGASTLFPSLEGPSVNSAHAMPQPDCWLAPAWAHIPQLCCVMQGLAPKAARTNADHG